MTDLEVGQSPDVEEQVDVGSVVETPLSSPAILGNPEQAASVVAFNDAAKGVPTNPEDVRRAFSVGDMGPIYSSYLSTKMAEVQTARENALSAAFGGDVAKTEFFARYEQQQRDLATAETKLMSQYFTVSKDAYEQSAAQGGQAVVQPEKIDTAGNNAAVELTMAQWMSQKAENVFKNTFGGKVFGTVGALVWELIPGISSVEQFAQIPSVISNVTGQEREKTGVRAILATRRFLASMDASEQQVVLDKIYKDLSVKMNDVFALSVIASLIDDQLPKGDSWYEFEESPAFLKFTEKLDIAGAVGDLTLLGGALTRFVKAAVARGNLIRYIKETQGAKAAADIAVEEIIKKGSGNYQLSRQEALDLARANTLNNIIGTSLSGMSGSMQTNILRDTEALIEGLRSVLFSSGKTKDEIAASIKEHFNFAQASNPHIISVSPVEISERGATVQIIHGTETGGAFATREAAEAYAKQNLSGATKVVELKSNAGFGVATEKISALEAEVTILREAVVKQTKEAGVRSKKGLLSGEDVKNDNFVAAFSKEDPPTAREVVVAIADNSSNPMLQQVARRILGNTNINLDSVPFGRMGNLDGDGIGVYRYLEDSIGMKNAIPDEATALHEIIHAVTSQVIDAVRYAPKNLKARVAVGKAVSVEQQTAVRNLDLLFNAISQSSFSVKYQGNTWQLRDMSEILSSVDQNMYGFMHVNEMVAEALTNKTFAEVLNKIPLSKIVSKEDLAAMGGKNKSVWDALTEWFVSVLGGSKKEQTALQAVLEESWKLIDSVSEDQRTLVKTLIDNKQLKVSDMATVMKMRNKPHITLKAGVMLEKTLAAKEQELLELKALGDEAFQGYVIAQVKEDPALLSKVGGFDPEDVSSMRRFLGFDDKHLSSELLVDQYTASWHITAANRKLLTDYFDKIVKPLKAKEKRALYSVLSEGDAASNLGGVGKEFSRTELLARWEEEFGARAEKLVEAYVRTRVLRNTLHHLKDTAAVRLKKASGYTHQVQFSLDGKTPMTGVAKPINDYSTIRGQRVFDVKQQKYVDVDDKFDTLYSGSKVYELDEAVEIGGINVRKFVASAEDVASAELTSIIPRRPGEFQRIYDDPFFISVTGSKLVDDARREVQKTLRTAKNYKEAERYVAVLKEIVKRHKAGSAVSLDDLTKLIGKWEDPAALQKRLLDGEFDWVDDVVLRVSRSEDEYVNNFVDALSSNGMVFTSSRGEKLTPIDNPQRTNTLSVKESLAAELSSVSRFMSVYELRASSIQRWFNHGVKENAIPKSLHNMSPVDAFVAYRKEKLSYLVDSQDKIFSQRAWNYINEQLGVKTKSEQKVDEIQNALATKILSVDNPGLFRSSIGAYLRQSNLIDDWRSVTAHLNLGMFNIGQIIVQSASFATAAIRYPQHALPAMKTAFLARFALMFDNPDAWRFFGTADSLTSLGLSSVDEFVDLVKAVRKSGIISGIQSTSLYTKEGGAFNTSSRVMKTLGGISMIPFNRGEEMARLMAFDVSRRVMKAEGKVNILDDFTLRDVMRMQDDLTQNMTRGNEAIFTRGAIGVPLQFMQFFLKMAGNFIGALTTKNAAYRGFTRRDVFHISAGYTVLYGISNGGFSDLVEETLGENVVDKLAETLGITDPDDIYNLRITVAEGIIAGAINAMSESLTGESLRIAVGSRLGVFNWMNDWAGYLIDNDKTFAELMLGASYRTVKSMGAVLGPFLRPLWKNDEVTPDMIVADLLDIAATSSSQFNNFQKMWLYKNNENKLVSANGTYIAPLSKKEVYAKLIGLSSIPEVEYNRLRKDESKYRKSIEENVGRWIAQQRVRAMAAHNSGNTELATKLEQRIDRMMPDHNTQEREWVVAYLERTKKDWKPALQKELEKRMAEKWSATNSNARPFYSTDTPEKVYPKQGVE